MSRFSSLIKAVTTMLMMVMLVAAVEQQAAKTMPIKLGTRAPDFTLLDSAGEKRSLVEFRGKAQIALVFYPALFRDGG